MVTINWKSGARFRFRIKPEHIRDLMELNREFGPMMEEVYRRIRANSRVMEVYKKRGFHWADHLEMPPEEFVELLSHAFGMTGQIREAAHSADPPGTMLASARQDDGSFKGRKGTDALASLLGLLFANNATHESMMLHGCSFPELLAQGAAGRDGAFLDAIRIDPLAASTPSFTKRLSVAIVSGDKKFLNGYQNALGGKTGRQQHQLNSIRYAMRVLIEDGQDRLSDKDLWRIFVQEVKAYPATGTPKNLRKHYVGVREVSTTLKR